MDNYAFFDQWYDDFLEHSGVKGMKHGVRNYQYPDGTWTELGKERRRIGNLQSRYKTEKSKQNRRSRKPLSNQDVDFYKSIRYDLNAVNEPDPSNPLDVLDSEGRKKNCSYCAVAYELRRSGYYNAKAKPSIEGRTNRDIAKVFGKSSSTEFDVTDKDGVCKEYSDAKKKAKTFKELWEAIKQSRFSKEEAWEMEDELRSQGNGARGILLKTFYHEGSIIAHALNYEIYNNAVYAVDSQSRCFYNDFQDSFKDAFRVTYIRTDDVNPDINAAKNFLGMDLKKRVKI